MGFDNINMDLIAGLPGDSVEGFCKTVDKVIALQPENVTVHTLSIKRSASYGESWEERRKALEQAQQVGQMVSYAQKQLMQSGWMPYYLYKQRNTLGNLENTGYCKPGWRGTVQHLHHGRNADDSGGRSGSGHQAVQQPRRQTGENL